MISHIFPTINGVSPTETRVTTPYFEVMFTDTPYTVKSRGFKTTWYARDTFSDSLSFAADEQKYISYIPFMKFYSGKYYPTEISQEYNNSQQFGFLSTAYFIPNTTTATFHFMGTGKVLFRLYTNFPVTYQELSLTSLGLTKESKVSKHITGLSAGTKYYIAMYYLSNNKKQGTDNTFVATWEDSTLCKPIVMSSGYFKEVELAGEDISSYKLSNILKASFNVNKGQSTKFSFSVPLATQGASIGYKYVSNGDYLVDVTNANKKIQKFRMIEYNVGYKYENSSISTLKKFSGQIRNWNISRGKLGDEVTIECYDWMSFLNDSFNIGYPNVSDYLAAGYLEDVPGGVAGRTKPRTYDAWELTDAVDNILLNAYIDPYVMNQERKYENVDEKITTDNYTMFDKNNSNPIFLDRQFHYGRPLAVDVDVDEGYLWQFSVGESLSDGLQKICDNYGFKYGFNNEGNFYMESIRNPIRTKSIDAFTFASTWTEKLDVHTLYSVYKSTASSGKCVATFIGSAVKGLFEVGSFGTVHLKLSNPTLGQVASGDYHIRRASSWGFNDGIDDSIGYNPCIVKIGTNLSYGSYSLNISSVVSTININAILIYDKNYDDAFATFYTSSSGGVNAVVLDNLSVSSDASYVRNDVTVVGKLKGIRSSLSVSEGQFINPNNPVSDHVISRTVDRVSLGSISSVDYVGRPLQMMIVDPKIATEDRASWLSYETIDRYNKNNKSLLPSAKIIGNPKLEVGDYIKILDGKTNALVTLHNYWINSITDTHEEKGSYISTLRLESFKPWESYYKYPIPSMKRFGNNVFSNVKYYNTGLCPKTLVGYETYVGFNTYNNSGTIVIEHIDGKMQGIKYKTGNDRILAFSSMYNDMNRKIPVQGYMKIQREIIKYDDRTVVCTIDHNIDKVYTSITFGSIDVTRGMYATSTIENLHVFSAPFSYRSPVDLSISPYMSEESHIDPAIQFDLLIPGFVKVAVEDSNSQVLEYLTGADVRNAVSSWVYLDAGTHYFSWGMLDRIGNHNESNSGWFKNAGGPTDRPDAMIVRTANDWEEPNVFCSEWVKNSEVYIPKADYYVQNRKGNVYESSHFRVSFMDSRNTYIDSVHVLDNVTPIFTSLKHSGSENAYNTPVEEFRLNIPISSWVADLSTLWFNIPYNRHIWPSWPADKANIDDPSSLQVYYTGMENGGSGFKVHITNGYSSSRIVNIEIKRYVLVKTRYDGFVHNGYYYADNPKSITKTVNQDEQTLTLGKGYTYNIDGINGADIYIGVPNLEFVTPEVTKSFNSYLTTEVLEDGRNRVPKYNIRSFAVSHIHCFEIKATDMSGRQSVLRRSAFWVPNDIINTKEMNDNRPSGTYDGLNISGFELQSNRTHSDAVLNAGGYPYTMVNFHAAGNDGWYESNYSILNGEVYKPLVHNNNRDERSGMYLRNIMGVQVYGLSRWL